GSDFRARADRQSGGAADLRPGARVVCVRRGKGDDVVASRSGCASDSGRHGRDRGLPARRRPDRRGGPGCIRRTLASDSGGQVALAAVAEWGGGGGAAADVPLGPNRQCSGLLGGTGGVADGRSIARFGYSAAVDEWVDAVPQTPADRAGPVECVSLAVCADGRGTGIAGGDDSAGRGGVGGGVKVGVAPPAFEDAAVLTAVKDASRRRAVPCGQGNGNGFPPASRREARKKRGVRKTRRTAGRGAFTRPHVPPCRTSEPRAGWRLRPPPTCL